MCSCLLGIGLALIWGGQQPVSETIGILRLDVCALPCWIGIVPGKTTRSEAKELVENIYGDDRYSVQIMGDSYVRVLLNGTLDSLDVKFVPASYNDPESPIVGITLVPDFRTATRIRPSVGEIVSSIGSPEDISAQINFSNYTPLMRFNRRRIYLELQTTVCNKFSSNQQVAAIRLYDPPPNYLWITEPSKWLGFGRCNVLEFE